MKRVFSLITLLFLFAPVFAESGPPIPTPKVSLFEASTLAMESLVTNYKGNVKGEEFLLISAHFEFFGNNQDLTDGWVDGGDNTAYLEKIRESWAWKVTFIHPIQNDISYTYVISCDGEIVDSYGTD